MSHETILRGKARAELLRGHLPARPPDRGWGGPGVGVACALCELPVTTDETEIGIKIAADVGGAYLDAFHFHIRCFAAWEFERNKPDESSLKRSNTM